MSDKADLPLRRFRLGIDVGGTFTKAALVEEATNNVVERFSVPTTHHHDRGVAQGVVDVFKLVLTGSQVLPGEIVFIAHSTTQATNALLEGDVARVGVLGMAPSNAARLAEAQVRIEAIELAAGKTLQTTNAFLLTDGLTDEAIGEAVARLLSDGAEVLVASAAFGNDNVASEKAVGAAGLRAGVPTTCGHDVSRLYGLATRTRTAVINASILPRMISTADMTEQSVKDAGILAPLMIMRGDGGVMDIEEMRRRPALTMLSGPAASVAGALMHVGVSDGIYFEVGGTSTNLGVIKAGRPTVKYARVGGHETYVSSLDVRVLGVAGGSLIRVRDGRILEVGPRSAHIAGLRYASFADRAQMNGAHLVLFEPKEGDGAEYVAIETVAGERYALTTTCAANAFGSTGPGMYCHSGSGAAEAAFRPFAEYLGLDVAGAAQAVLDAVALKVLPAIDDLIAEYKLDEDQRIFVGVGGGVGAILPYVAEKRGFRFEIAGDAEIISSIGAALAMVREVIERIIPNPQDEDLKAIRAEARDAVARLGADPHNIDVSIEIDRMSNRVRATATGAADMKVARRTEAIGEAAARGVAARSFGVSKEELHLVQDLGGIRIYSTQQVQPFPIRLIDQEGRVRAQRSNVYAGAARADELLRAYDAMFANAEHADDDLTIVGAILILSGRIVDLTGLGAASQVAGIMRSEAAGHPPDTSAGLIGILARKRSVVDFGDP